MAILRNMTPNKITVRAADGDSVDFGPGLTCEVDDKFLWNLPTGIRHIGAASTQSTESASSNFD